jgi:hypothetical protein
LSAKIKLKQIKGSTSGSILFVNTSNSITEDFSKLNWNSEDSILTINGKVKITDGSESPGYVLTSDADGLATWAESSFIDQSMHEVPLSGTQNGINKVFTLAYDINDSQNILFVNGVLYDDDHYTINGTTLTITGNIRIEEDDELKLYSNINITNNNNNNSTLIYYVSRSELEDLINTDSLIPGALYNIEDAHSSLFGGTEIVHQATGIDKLNPQGVGKFYNPKYNGVGNSVWNKWGWFKATSVVGTFTRNEQITANNGATGVLKGIVVKSTSSTSYTFFTPLTGNWTSATSITGNTSGATCTINTINVPTYSIGDKVNWGGKVWANLTGLVGSNSGEYTLDNNWEVVPYNTNDYNEEWDQITYDVEMNFITSRRDKLGNYVVQSYSNYDQVIGQSSIKAFQWGNSKLLDNTIENSIFETINHMGNNIECNRVVDSSFIYFNNVFGRGFVMYQCEFKTYTTFDSNFFFNPDGQCGLFYMTIGEISSIRECEFTNGSQLGYSLLTSSEFWDSSVSNISFFNNSFSSAFINYFRAYATTNFGNVAIEGNDLKFGFISFSNFNGNEVYEDKNLINLKSCFGFGFLQITTSSTIIWNTIPTKTIYRRSNGTLGISFINNSDVVQYANANS